MLEASLLSRLRGESAEYLGSAAVRQGSVNKQARMEAPQGALHTTRQHRTRLVGTAHPSLAPTPSQPCLPSLAGPGHWVSHSHILYSIAHVVTPRLGLAATPSVATHCVLGLAVYGILRLLLGGGAGWPPTRCCPAGSHGFLEESEGGMRRN